MGDPLKTFFSPELVRRLAEDLVRSDPTFPKEAFVEQAAEGLDALELLDRGRHIARALAEHLPKDYPQALDVLIRSLGPEHATDELIGAGMEPFFYYPHTLFVAERGLGHFDLSMRAQLELTRRFSAEGSIRPYIAADPERSFALMRSWARSDNAHVRRLVSEGTRLRLPWARRVAWLDEHPERIVELLEMLKDDPSTMVRRSVANNLNDLSKVHPDLMIRTCEAWLEGASAERRSLVEHALRSAVKRGEPSALRLLGYGERAAVRADDVSFHPPRVTIGGAVTIAFTLTNTSDQEHALLVDLAVHFVKVRGTTRKVFKLDRLVLAPHAKAALSTTVSLAVHTTRAPRPGTHAVEAIVNGQPVALGSFEVEHSAR